VQRIVDAYAAQEAREAALKEAPGKDDARKGDA
jgi:hypothetical protein